MIFKQIVHADLGCASYLIGDDKAGVVAVVDPRFEIDEYLELASYLGVRITDVFETHNHADHVSGHGRLAAATGATIHVHELVAPEFEHEPFGHGDEFALGSLRIKALHTPGHRPEHTCFLLTDTHRGDEPWAVLSGDSLFVGDVARADLAVEATAGARGIFQSLRDQLLALPDYIEVWPGHLGGSMCGGPGMDLKGSSTIGFERRHNQMLSITDEDEFVATSVASLGAQPPNFKGIVTLNHGPLLTEPVALEPLSAAQVARRLPDGALVVDVRDDLSFAEGHVPGALWIPLHKSGFGTKLAWLAAAAPQIVFVCAQDEDAERAAALAGAVGLAAPVRRGGFLAGGIDAWSAAGEPLQSLQRVATDALEPLIQGESPVQVLDARERSEFEAGHIPGSVHETWHDITGVPEGLDPEQPIAVICAAGLRAGVAASLLQHHGAAKVIHVVDGGVPKWASLGGPLSFGASAPERALA
jgi:glyoxylase-like metal-dependent hydrolase (beta-lactamase superfamily II)/rhodanese-related sulfurtransferase